MAEHSNNPSEGCSHQEQNPFLGGLLRSGLSGAADLGFELLAEKIRVVIVNYLGLGRCGESIS